MIQYLNIIEQRILQLLNVVFMENMCNFLVLMTSQSHPLCSSYVWLYYMPTEKNCSQIKIYNFPILASLALIFSNFDGRHFVWCRLILICCFDIFVQWHRIISDEAFFGLLLTKKWKKITNKKTSDTCRMLWAKRKKNSFIHRQFCYHLLNDDERFANKTVS